MFKLFSLTGRNLCRLFAALLLAFFCQTFLAPQISYSFDAQKAGFSVRFKDEVSPYRVIALFALPGESVTIQVITQEPKYSFTLQKTKGTVKKRSGGVWEWQAPRQTGYFPITITNSATRETVQLNAFVMVPMSGVRDQCINGYKIGSYPACPPQKEDIYAHPRGFIEVDSKTSDVLVSPHFRLGQFMCKQSGGDQKYLVLRERLLLKLELVLEEANKRGYRAETFYVMSGYRTPSYNKSIGNVAFSRHLWGDAADVFIDNDGNGVMDDLNHDGRLDQQDAVVLYNIVEDLYGEKSYDPFIGGLGAYRSTKAHGPFVHMDVRGVRARWGVAPALASK